MKVDNKLAKKILEFLKNRAMAQARMRRAQQSASLYDLMSGMGVAADYASRNKAYALFIFTLAHLCELGCVEKSKWGSMNTYRYVGPEPEKERERIKDLDEERYRGLKELLEKLGVKSSRAYYSNHDGGAGVSLDYEEFAMLLRSGKIKKLLAFKL